jgi:hypothetical protein
MALGLYSVVPKYLAPPRPPKSSSCIRGGQTDLHFSAVQKPVAPPAARVSASQAILDRGYGRPASFTTGDSQTFKRAIDMTDDELAAIVAKARLTVVK